MTPHQFFNTVAATTKLTRPLVQGVYGPCAFVPRPGAPIRYHECGRRFRPFPASRYYADTMSLGAGEMQAITDVCDALGSSLDLTEALRVAYPPLLKAIPADYAAVGVTTTGLPNELDWIAPSVPAAFFESYADMAAHDFVLRAVRGAPNRVLRDCEMLPRGELESNLMYGRARDLGMPIEHVMSTLLDAGEDWNSGISLYRAEPLPVLGAGRRRARTAEPGTEEHGAQLPPFP